MVPRLVVHENPEGRTTPLLLLASLRELDSTVELVYFGARDWRLGAVRPTPLRLRAGAAILQNEEARSPRERNPKNLLLGALYKQGFAQIAKYTEVAGGDISGTVITETEEHTTVFAHFERIQHAWNADQGEQEVRAAVEANSPNARKQSSKKQFNDYMATEGRAHYARETKGRVTFGHGGMTGQGSALLHRGTYAKPIITGDEVLHDLQQIMADLGGESGSLL